MLCSCPALLCVQHKFYFDQVFGEESSNEEVYRRTAYPLVQHMLNGYAPILEMLCSAGRGGGVDAQSCECFGSVFSVYLF